MDLVPLPLELGLDGADRCGAVLETATVGHLETSRVGVKHGLETM